MTVGFASVMLLFHTGKHMVLLQCAAHSKTAGAVHCFAPRIL